MFVLKSQRQRSEVSLATVTISFHSTFHLQRIFQSVVQFHDGCLVTTAVAVVWSTKDGHHVLVVAPVVSLETETVHLDWERSLSLVT